MNTFSVKVDTAILALAGLTDVTIFDFVLQIPTADIKYVWLRR
jgi:hypothetical protein